MMFKDVRTFSYVIILQKTERKNLLKTKKKMFDEHFEGGVCMSDVISWQKINWFDNLFKGVHPIKIPDVISWPTAN